jgi:molybdopterin synthase catalytic subunit
MTKNLEDFESCRITTAPLNLQEVYDLAADPANGSVNLMCGTVRNQTNQRPVDFLEYEAYESMALKVFAHIAEEIYQRWPDTNRVVIHHRIGKLHIGEISVIVAVGSPHRQEGFEACQYAIDTLKYNAPVWKKEYWEDGRSEWVEVKGAKATDRNEQKNEPA